MNRLFFRFGLIAVILVVAGLLVYPPNKKLRLGKDLAGGTTLTYGVLPDAEGRAPNQATVDQIISVVSERVDPNGVYDISIVSVGTSQIEISMPAPTEEVRRARERFEELLDAIGSMALAPGAVDEAVRLPTDERTARIEELAAGVPERRQLLESAAEAYDRMIEARQAYEAIIAERDAALAGLEEAERAASEAYQAVIGEWQSAGMEVGPLLEVMAMAPGEARQQRIADLAAENPDAEAILQRALEANEAQTQSRQALQAAETEWSGRIDPLEQAAAEAELAFDDARQAVLATSVNVEEIREALGAETTPIMLRNRQTGRWEASASPRELALQRIVERAPIIADRLNEVTEAYDYYRSISRGYDDPKDLIALLRGAGILTFQIGVQPSDPLPIETILGEFQERGPARIESATGVRWYPIDQLEEWYDSEDELEALRRDPTAYFARRNLVAADFNGQVYVLLYTTPDRALTEASGPWQLTEAAATTDELGRPAVRFQLDPQGAQKFGQLTGNNIDRPMAIVLDGRVYSAPNINSRITSTGTITGRFSDAEIRYLLRVLNSGSLQARMTPEPIAQSTIGPKLGRDNLERGVNAGLLALALVGVFMIAYYFLAGFMADVALLCNALLILAAMAAYKAAFTMPGIAGIVLTFGMAVDANVLIYERMREELERGVDLKTAIRLGYEKALSSIIDGNVTNLIVVFVLALAATAEVKGFGITLGIGIVCTLFSALYINRALLDFYTDVMGGTSLRMLPTVWKTLNRALSPNVNWVAARPVFYTVGGVAVAASLWLTWITWNDMLDTEFLGGTSVTMTLREEEPGRPLMLPRAEVEERLQAAAQAAYESGEITEEQNRAILGAAVYNRSVDEVEGEDFRGSSFVIKSTIQEPAVLERIVLAAFGDQLEVQQAIEFAGFEEADVVAAPVYPILEGELGRNIGEPGVTEDVRAFLGGVAIVLRDMRPAPSLETIEDRISRLRSSPEYDRYLGRDVRVIGLRRAESDDGEAIWSDAVVLVHTPDVTVFDSRDAWETQVAGAEWGLVRSALSAPESLEQVTTVSAAVAKQFRGKAVVAILLSMLGILAYVWVRFGSLWYSSAAVLALGHDVLVTLGLLSLTHYVYNTVLGQALLVEPFKIDLGVVAALLTIIGYSLNDTIVIMDRIRENRGKLTVTSAKVVNDSINQTLSRTVLTSGTTLIATLILYIEGGSGVRPFAFAILCGIITGTYSTVGIAAPMVFRRKTATREEQKATAPAAATSA